MKIDDISAFISVVRCHSLSLAAQEQGITQPAITRRIQNLEEALGVSLLDRNTKPPKPTAIGLRASEQCRIILREIESLRDIVSEDVAATGNLSIGMTHSIGELALLTTLAALAKEWPDLNPSVTTDWGNRLIKRLENAELDAATVFLPADTLLPRKTEGRILMRTQLQVVAKRGTWSGKAVNLTDCHHLGWVLNPDGCGFRAGLKRAMDERHIPLLIHLDTYGQELQMQCVAQGMGLGLMPKPLLHNGAFKDTLEIVNITDFKPAINLWLVHRLDLGKLQEPVEAFGRHVGDIFNHIGRPV
jgi:DNA-binding transcriptional LysR family regulator